MSSVERTGRKQQNRKFIGFSQALEERREVRARRNKPPPWIVQKFMIGVVVAIACYAWYVYIAVFCVPMIRQDDNALGGRRLGGKPGRRIVLWRVYLTFDTMPLQSCFSLYSAYLG